MKKLTICYFGIYNPEFSRNQIYIAGLRKIGVTVIECRDDSAGLLKFWNLYKKHKEIRGKYDVLVVGYPGHLVVPWARFLSSKSVIFDALGTLHEAEVESHWAGPLKALRLQFIDWLAVKTAHMVLVESESQRQYFLAKFAAHPDKIKVLYTGVSDQVLSGSRAPKLSRFTVLFRGSLTPESGMEHILEAASLIKENHARENICFLVMGRGIMEEEVRRMMMEKNLDNTELVTEKFSWLELSKRMSQCHVSLGQFAHNPRLERTIPHKAFESLALGLPYVTARAKAVSEILVDGESCLMVNPGDADDLAQKILRLKSDQALSNKIAENGRHIYELSLNPEALATRLISFL